MATNRAGCLSRWRVVALFSAVIALAAGLRAYGLAPAVFSADESFSWRLTQFSVPELVRRTALDVHPPLYYLLLQGWLAGWKTSPLAVRGLSVVWGVLSVAMAYLLCVDSLTPRSGEKAVPIARSVALFCAFSLAIHVTEVVPARSARMYSLGVFLAGLTAWLLLRALRSTRGWLFWWTAYGVAVAGFCYTHNFAFFSLSAQVVFVAGDLWVRAHRGFFRAALPSLKGFLYAASMAILLYSPWIRVLLSQARTVHEYYWIPDFNADQVVTMVCSWATGMDSPGAPLSWLVVGLVTLMCFWVSRIAGRPAWFFMLQAFIPWALALGLSIVSGRPILLDRCMAFAHIAFLPLLSVTLFHLPSHVERCVLGSGLAVIYLFGLHANLASLPDEAPAVQGAATFLKNHYCHDSDIIQVFNARELNRLRFYATCAGLGELNVRLPVDVFGGPPLHIHGASLAATDYSSEDSALDPRILRQWQAGSNPLVTPPQGMKVAFTQEFRGGARSRYRLILFEKDK